MLSRSTARPAAFAVRLFRQIVRSRPEVSFIIVTAASVICRYGYLSGQRCLTRRAFELASPLAAGWGMEVGMTIDILRAGLRIEEVDIDLQHRATGRDLAGQVHRAKQLRDVTRALAARGDSNRDTARGLVQSGIDDMREADGLPGLIKRLKR